MLQMCASALCQDAPSGTRRAPPPFECRSLIGSLSPPVCIIDRRPSRSNDETVLSALLVAIFLLLPKSKEKGDPDNRMSAGQLLVAISSRLPQLRIGPQSKYRAGSHAHRMWMPRPDCFWRGRSSGPLFHVHMEIYEV